MASSANAATTMRREAMAMVSKRPISHFTIERLAPHTAIVPSSSQRIIAARAAEVGSTGIGAL